MSCCQNVTLTVGGEGCPQPIIDQVLNITTMSPIAIHRPGCYAERVSVHLTKGQFIFARVFSYNANQFPPFNQPCTGIPPFDCSFVCTQCSSYLYLLDSTDAIVVEQIDDAGSACVKIGVLIETEGDYTFECTSDLPGTTMTSRLTVWSDFVGVSTSSNGGAVMETNAECGFVAPQSVQPLTWAVVDGTLPPETSLGGSFYFPLSGKVITGVPRAPQSPGSFIFALQVTDANGLKRKLKIFYKVIAFEGFGPGFNISPNPGVFYSKTFVPTGGCPPYTFHPIAPTAPQSGVPHGMFFDFSTGTLSGTPVGDDYPKSISFWIIDSQNDYAVSGAAIAGCVIGQTSIGGMNWPIATTIPNPPGDSITGSMSNGDGHFDLANAYPGFGPCTPNPTVLNVTGQLCNKDCDGYDVTCDIRIFGTLGDVSCPLTDSHAQVSFQGFGFPVNDTIGPPSVPGQLYDVTFNTLTVHVDPLGILNFSFLFGITFGTMTAIITIRPLTPPSCGSTSMPSILGTITV